MKIPGLFFSWKRVLGVTQAKQQFARKTGISTTKAGLERKIGRMRMKCIIPFIGILCLSVLMMSSCGNTSEKSVKTTVSNNSKTSRTDSVKVCIFGVEAERDEYSLAKKLEKAGIIIIDAISTENGKFQSASIEFANIKFGMNKGFIFVTSRHDKDAVNLLVSKISEFYGEPEIEDDLEDPAYRYYQWNLYKNEPDAPSIRIRPVHSEEGGLIMMWDL